LVGNGAETDGTRGCQVQATNFPTITGLGKTLTIHRLVFADGAVLSGRVFGKKHTLTMRGRLMVGFNLTGKIPLCGFPVQNIILVRLFSSKLTVKIDFTVISAHFRQNTVRKWGDGAAKLIFSGDFPLPRQAFLRHSAGNRSFCRLLSWFFRVFLPEFLRVLEFSRKTWTEKIGFMSKLGGERICTQFHLRRKIIMRHFK
jgi:hypothetical protein